MTSTLVLVFDGTGPADDTAYDKIFKWSFCCQISERSNGIYHRGPPGDEDHLVDSVYGTIRPYALKYVALAYVSASAFGPYDRLMLVGYSRGGLAALQFATTLNYINSDRKIEAVFLFDAVAMELPWITQVPSNVENCYHAMRDPKFAADMRKRMTLPNPFSPTTSQRFNGPGGAANAFQTATTRFREQASPQQALLNEQIRRLQRTRSDPTNPIYNWGNCGTRATAATKFVSNRFACSHGAMGGLPWDDWLGDREGAQSVANWMFPHLMSHGIAGVWVTQPLPKSPLPDGFFAARPGQGPVNFRK